MYFKDTNGEFFDIIWDVASLIFSIADVISDPTDGWAWAGLAGDVVDLIPGVTGAGESIKAARAANKVADAVDTARDVMRTADNAVEVAENISNSRRLIKSINGLTENVGFTSFDALKKSVGPAGEGKHWHHIVEQSQIQKSGFSAQQIHNTSNIIAVDASTHAKITGHYNSKKYLFTEGKSVRDWLSGQSYEAQYEYGIKVLKDYGVIE